VRNIGFENAYREYCEERRPGEFSPRYDGLLLKYLGDLSLGATPEDISRAIDYYRRSLHLVARYETYQPFGIEAQLQCMDELLNRLPVPPKEVARLGKDLLATWKESGLDREHPEALPFFLRWKRQGEVNRVQH